MSALFRCWRWLAFAVFLAFFGWGLSVCLPPQPRWSVQGNFGNPWGVMHEGAGLYHLERQAKSP
ncbi:MAG: hypothetical protein HY040_20420 [Planctomycetes bacterium]|nr:hypothetical protein [Planctomycetota bacterium]